MTSHVHLRITPDRADAVRRLIIALGQRYVQYINTTYRRSSTLWDSRYKSSLIQAETYRLSCQRYTDSTPCAPPRWTIPPFRLDQLSAGRADPYPTPHELHLAIGRDDAERQVAYRELFRTKLDNETVDDIRLALNQNQPLGNSGFHARIEATTGHDWTKAGGQATRQAANTQGRIPGARWGASRAGVMILNTLNNGRREKPPYSRSKQAGA